MPETLLQVTRPTEFSAEAAAAAPMVISYILTSEVTIQTTVIGDARNIASVAILDGSVTVWTTTLTQAAPDSETPYALVLCRFKIDAGAGFHLTIPTSLQRHDGRHHRAAGDEHAVRRAGLVVAAHGVLVVEAR